LLKEKGGARGEKALTLGEGGKGGGKREGGKKVFRSISMRGRKAKQEKGEANLPPFACDRRKGGGDTFSAASTTGGRG